MIMCGASSGEHSIDAISAEPWVIACAVQAIGCTVKYASISAHVWAAARPPPVMTLHVITVRSTSRTMADRTIIAGDCLTSLSALADSSADAVVTDPPAGIGFMGRAWDSDKGGREQWIEWLRGVMIECLRILKPGGHALVWAIPRTSHWTATAIDLAGFEIRDVLTHHFGSGFPKSLDVSKQIDRAARVHGGSTQVLATNSAKQWSGFGTALKPAAEFWILARKPLEGTVTANVLKYGTGALNIDGCRVGDNPGYRYSADRNGTTFHGEQGARVRQTALKKGSEVIDSAKGRWPPNLLLTHGAECRHDGVRSVRGDKRGDPGGTRPGGFVATGASKGSSAPCAHVYSDETIPVWDCAPDCPIGELERQHRGASRFFSTFRYQPKPSRSERDAGLGSWVPMSGGEATGREDGSDGLKNPRAGAGRNGGARNPHPTVKSVDLMRWLVRLIAPPGGLVLDPFAGSGSTGIACVHEGMEFIGCEVDPEYAKLAQARIAYAESMIARQLSMFESKGDS